MAKIIEKSPKVLVMKAYPKCMLGLCIMFLLVLVFAAMLSLTDAEFKDYAIFIGVCAVFIAIQKHKVTRFDKNKNEGEIVTTTVLGSKKQQFKLTEVKNVQMVYGKGQYARGGAISLELKTNCPIIADSDICFGNRERNIRLTEEIIQWL
jgi:hypothetical protein